MACLYIPSSVCESPRVALSATVLCLPALSLSVCLDLGPLPSQASGPITVSSSSWSAWRSCISFWRTPSNLFRSSEDSVARSCNCPSACSCKLWRLDSSPESWLKAMPVEIRGGGGGGEGSYLVLCPVTCSGVLCAPSLPRRSIVPGVALCSPLTQKYVCAVCIQLIPSSAQ